MREAECGTDASTVPRVPQGSSAYGRSAGLRDVGDQNRRVLSRGMPTQVPPEAASLGIDVMPSLDCRGSESKTILKESVERGENGFCIFYSYGGTRVVCGHSGLRTWLIYACNVSGAMERAVKARFVRLELPDSNSNWDSNWTRTGTRTRIGTRTELELRQFDAARGLWWAEDRGKLFV